MYWNDYFEAYVGEFDSLTRNGSSETYKLTIYSKTPLIPSGLNFAKDPCVIRYLDDNAFPAIKGCELEVNLLNLNGTMPSSTFYSKNEDEFKAKLECNGVTLFVGFLLQKEITEIQVDFTHEFRLIFTDGLATLREIPFNLACQSVPSLGGLNITPVTSRLNSFAESAVFYAYLDVTSLAGNPAVNDTLIIENARLINGVYRITRKKDPPHNPVLPFVNRILQLAEPINTYSVTGRQAFLYYFTPYDTNNVISLKDVIKICVAMTGTNLNFSIGYNLTSPHIASNDLFSNVFVDIDTFRRNENWLSCYEVLESIMKTFRFTIMQSAGLFRLIRWFDLKDSGNSLFGQTFSYPNYNFAFSNQLIATRTIGDGTDIETGLNRTLERPLKFSQQIFEISTFENCPKNNNLQKLGAMYQKTTSGTEIVRKYNLADWSLNPAAPTVETAIVSRSDIYGNEVERYIYINRLPGTNSGSYECVQSLPVKINEGDEFTYEFQFNVYGWQGGNETSYHPKLEGYVGIKHTDYQGNVGWLKNEEDDQFSWDYTPGTLASWFYKTTNASGEFWERWVQFSVKAKAPKDGYLTFYLFNLMDFFPTPDGVTEFRFKDIKVTIKPFLSGSTLMAKKLFNSYQWDQIKNSKEETILIDSSNKLDVKGILKYYNGQSGYIGMTRWELFNFESTLGQIMTRQDVIQNKVTRLKFEGKTFPIVQGGSFLYAHTLISLQFILDKWFVFGKLELNFKENDANFTLYELYDIAEVTNYGVLDDDVQSVINYNSK
jgi:hypothetical protein